MYGNILIYRIVNRLSMFMLISDIDFSYLIYIYIFFWIIYMYIYIGYILIAGVPGEKP